MGEDAEAELGIFVQDLALRHVVAQMLLEERFVHQHFLDDRGNFLAPSRPGVFLEDAVHGVGELFEVVSHGLTSSSFDTLFAPAPQWALYAPALLLRLGRRRRRL